MTAITIRRLPADAKHRLRMRAAEKGRSMEAEARDILLEALAPAERVDLTWVELLMDAGRAYDADEGVVLELPEDPPAEPPDVGDLLVPDGQIETATES